MAITNDFPLIYTGNPYTTLDTYNAALQNNGANNPLGSLAVLQAVNPASLTNGRGSVLVGKYVRYLSTANPAVVGGPAPVYYTDETFTTVTGVFSEGLGGVANSVAGWMLPNTVSLTGFTAALLNGNFVWIGISGFIPACSVVTSTAVGDALIGASGNFVNARVAAGTAPTNRPLGYALTAISSGLSDVLATLPLI